MDTLVMNLLPRRVPRLAHVSEHSDAMLSIYPPPSGRFQKHIDNTARDGRCLTVLLYLNTGWTPEMGGALKLWPLKTGQVEGSLITTAAQTLSRGGGVEPVELPPIAGRLAMFYSDRVLHEVSRYIVAFSPTYGHHTQYRENGALICWQKWYEGVQ